MSQVVGQSVCLCGNVKGGDIVSSLSTRSLTEAVEEKVFRLHFYIFNILTDQTTTTSSTDISCCKYIDLLSHFDGIPNSYVHRYIFCTL